MTRGACSQCFRTSMLFDDGKCVNCQGSRKTIQNSNKMTKLQFINVLFVQWFFVRICRFKDDEGRRAFGFLGFVVPLTGWKNEYWIIGRMWNKRITKFQ